MSDQTKFLSEVREATSGVTELTVQRLGVKDVAVHVPTQLKLKGDIQTNQKSTFGTEKQNVIDELFTKGGGTGFGSFPRLLPGDEHLIDFSKETGLTECVAGAFDAAAMGVAVVFVVSTAGGDIHSGIGALTREDGETPSASDVGAFLGALKLLGTDKK